MGKKIKLLDFEKRNSTINHILISKDGSVFEPFMIEPGAIVIEEIPCLSVFF